MTNANKTEELISKITNSKTKLGDIKKLAVSIKKDHKLAIELWASEQYRPRLLAVLLFDKNMLTQSVLEAFAADMSVHTEDDQNQLADWLLANQLSKNKKLIALLEQWEHHPSPVLQRLFWYHQARLRWTGKTPPDNSTKLMSSLESNMANAEPQVQWAMNFCAGQIGIHEPQYRARCIKLGENLGLYKDEVVPKNFTPSYLPEFIRIEIAKR